MPGERQPPLQSTAYVTLGKSCKLLDKHPWTKCNQVCVMQLMIKGKCKALNCSVCLTLCNPHGLLPARLLRPWNSPGKNTGVGLPFPSPEDLPNPRIEPRSPALQADSLLSEPPGKLMIKHYVNVS